MSKRTDDIDTEKLKKIKADPPATKYKVHLKNLELVLSRREYVTLIGARNLLKKSMAHEHELNDADDVTDTMFYKEILIKSAAAIMDCGIHNALNNEAMRVLFKSLGLDKPNDNHKGHNCDQDPDKED